MDKKYKETLKQLAGAWLLVSSEFKTSSGVVIYPLGEDALGQCIFTESGYMSGQLMKQKRPPFAGGDPSSGTTEEIKAALEGFVSYYGPFDLDLEKGKLITHVEGSLFPNWVGHDQVRYFEFSGDTLILKPEPVKLGGEELLGVFIWNRR